MFTKVKGDDIYAGRIREFIDNLIVNYIKYNGELCDIVQKYLEKNDIGRLESDFIIGDIKRGTLTIEYIERKPKKAKES